MPGSNAPATLVICASVPKGLRPEGAAGRHRQPDVPVTWLAPWDRLAAAATLASSQPDSAAALEVPAGAFASRQRLRTVLARGREAMPDLVAIAVHRSDLLEHRGLLVEEGIRVALVASLGSADRGSRRPAPGGWRCRNAAWGLWEVELTPARRQGPLGWLRLPGLPRPRRRSLHVLATEGLTSGNGGACLSSRLERWLAWAGRHVDRGVAEAVSLPRLVARLAGEEHGTADRSVLRAA
jgi:hypothetical protein